MYKLLLCLRYLRTRWLAMVCIVSVLLGVATLIINQQTISADGNSAVVNALNLTLASGDQVIVAGAIDGDAEGEDARELQFFQRDHRVLDAVHIRAAVVTIVEVLRKTIAEQNHVL